MMNSVGPVLVFGATGQQGGSVARALLKAGRAVRILVRNPAAPAAEALREAGAEVFQGDFEDPASIRRAIKGADGVFSVQTSSPGGEITDEQEVAWGVRVADLAVEAGVNPSSTALAQRSGSSRPAWAISTARCGLRPTSGPCRSQRPSCGRPASWRC
ncbi:MAG: NmrA family NAD(P)-binding protein [Phenylobacterium sp.]|nr:NmrA family NAD(P)-binding protein [Phenylobacterium sp.]